MKVCFISDPHLFSSEIGGNWPEESYSIFKNRILPAINKEDPDVVIFLGDILDPHSGRTDPRWPKGDEASARFVEAIKEVNLKNVFSLKGNHDYLEPLRVISEMGGPKLIENDWLKFKDASFYFFSSRYPNIQNAEKDLKAIPRSTADTTILLMHENIGIPGAENLSPDLIEKISKNFDIIINGHEHVFRHPYSKVWCLSSALPWRPGYGNSDIEIDWKDEKPEITQNDNKFGVYFLDSKKKLLEFFPIDIGIKIVYATLRFDNAPANLIRERVIRLSELLPKIVDPRMTILRIYLEGSLREGDERIDVGFSYIEPKYFQNFYEGTSKNILRVDALIGGGAYLSKDDLRYVSVEDALNQIEGEIPNIREFYKEISDLIEKKTLDREALIERIKTSETLGAVHDV